MEKPKIKASVENINYVMKCFMRNEFYFQLVESSIGVCFAFDEIDFMMCEQFIHWTKMNQCIR